ncbi:hypothetical protein CSAL01_08421 [Colletotrichum salicis]|uniref:Uncharacterized protein n=1 Tax=Colletotrichum salicis TaxID=1209931 RepID=A0A135VAC0_9PEZI|nr:hypothetical protein CSAL01_08421 [Colletotrichum salicis]
MSQRATPTPSAGNKPTPFRYMEPYGHLAPPPEDPTHQFDNLEEALSIRINDKDIHCFRLVAAGKNTQGTGCAVRLHAFTTDSESQDIAMKGKREDVQVTVTPKDKFADEIAGEIMAISLGNQGCIVILVYLKRADSNFVEDEEWVKEFMDAEYEESIIQDWEDWVEV